MNITLRGKEMVMKKLLVLLMCLAAAVPAMADKLIFDKNGVYVSPSGWVVQALKTERIKLTDPVEAPVAPKDESTPADYVVLDQDGDRVKLWNSNNHKTYYCDRNGCR